MSTDLEPAPKPRRPQHSYTAEQVTAGLTQMALCGGNSRLASDQLAEMGYDIPEITLRKWRTDIHPARYAEIQTDLAPRIADKIATEAEEFILAAAQVEAQALSLVAEALPNMSPGERAGALRNITTSKALNLDKIASPLRGRPSQITEHRSAEDILRALEAKLPNLKADVDSTATEEQEQ